MGDDQALVRFISKTKIDPLTQCWIWQACFDGDGYYGRFWDKGRLHTAHRWAYENIIGPIPKKKVLDHLCTTKQCVNPHHLEPTTNQENVLRGFKRKKL